MSIDILLKHHLLSVANVFILSASIVNTVMYPLHGFHIRKDFLPLVLGVLSGYSLQLSDPSGFALSAEICFTQEASPHPVMDQCEYKGLDNSAQLGTAVKGHSSTRDPRGSAWCGITGMISAHLRVETTSSQLWGVLHQEPWNDSLSLGGENPIRER